MCLLKLRKGRRKEGPTPSQDPNTGQFIPKLWDILANNEDYGHIINWNDDGTMVCIHNVRLLPQVLAQSFRSSRHDSMERQYSHYGFTKNDLQYWHPKFRRDNPSCVWTMRRKTQPGTKCKRQAQAPPARRFQRARKVQGTVPKKQFEKTDFKGFSASIRFMKPIDWETYQEHLKTEMDQSASVSAENELDSITTAQKETDDMATLGADFVNATVLDEERAAVDGKSASDPNAEDAFVVDAMLRDLVAKQSSVIDPFLFS